MWKDLQLTDKAKLINLAVKSGITDLENIQKVYNEYKSGGKIYIKPENRGKFTALKKRTGHSSTWFKQHGTPAQKKMATFALNARKWKHQDGGELNNNSYNFMYNAPTLLEVLNQNTVKPIDYNEVKSRQEFMESGFKPQNKPNKKGAVGRFQITPVVLGEYIKATNDNGKLTDPNYNEKVRDWYFNTRLEDSAFINKGNPSDSVKLGKKLAAYNYGPTNVVKSLNKAKAEGIDIYNTFDWLPYLPKETQDYVNFSLRNKDINRYKNDSTYRIAKKLLTKSK